MSGSGAGAARTQRQAARAAAAALAEATVQGQGGGQLPPVVAINPPGFTFDHAGLAAIYGSVPITAAVMKRIHGSPWIQKAAKTSYKGKGPPAFSAPTARSNATARKAQLELLADFIVIAPNDLPGGVVPAWAIGESSCTSILDLFCERHVRRAERDSPGFKPDYPILKALFTGCKGGRSAAFSKTSSGGFEKFV